MRLLHAVALLAGGKKVRRALQAGVAEHEALQAQVDKKLQRIFNRVRKGKIDAEEFKGQFQRQLVSAYEDAYKVGKGDEKLSNKDRRWINSYAAQQFEFLDGFAEDIEAGNSNVNSGRVKLYANASQAAYWKGAASDFDGPLDWVLGLNDNNCDDCVELADGSPYEPDELPTTPGAGDTQCRSNCHCTLVAIS